MLDQFSRVALPVAAAVALGLGVVAASRAHGERRGQEMIHAAVQVDPGEIPEGGAVTFTLRVENGSDGRVTFEFMTSQRYEFLVTSASQDTVWRWGESRGFLQVLGQEQLAPGKALVYRESFEARLEPGRYVVTGVLAARNRPLQGSAEFEVLRQP